MVNETKLEDINPLADLKNKLWQTFNLIRGSVSTSDYYFLLYFLVLQRDNLLPELNKVRLDDLKFQIRDCILKFDGDNALIYKRVYNFFDPILFNLSNQATFDLLKFLNSLNQSVLKENFSEIFDDSLYKLSKYQGRYGGEFIQPVELSRFVCGLAELPKNATVYNPFAGFASFGVLLDPGLNYFGQEINPTTWAIGSLRIMAYERGATSRFVQGDSINNWNPNSEKYDLIIANPPFGVKKEWGTEDRPYSDVESDFIYAAKNSLTQSGKIIAILPMRFFFAQNNIALRKELINNDLIEMIISFPGGLLMNTGIPLSVLVINKDKKEKGNVRFVDAKYFVDSSSSRELKLNDNKLNSAIRDSIDSDILRIVSNDTIATCDFNLNVRRYFQKEFYGEKLGDIGTIIRGRRISKGEKGKFVRIRDLKDDKLDVKLSIEKIQEVDLPRQAQCIEESCMIMALRWKTLKPTFFNYRGTPIFLTHDALAFKVDESKVNIAFLINELQSNPAKEQLESVRTGVIIPSIRIDDLLNIKIPIPSLDEQKVKVKEALEVIAEEKKKELEFFKKIHGLESEIVEQNIYLRHTLAGPTSNLKGSINKLKKIISDKVLLKVPEIMTLKVSEQHDLTFGDYLNIIERDIVKITDAVSRQLSIETDISSKELTPIEIIDFLKRFKSEYSDVNKINFKIDLDFDKEMFANEEGDLRKTYILGNAELLTDLFNNLLENAIKHAFQKESNNRIEIYLMSSSQGEIKNNITIIFSNTGKPFPENFSESDFIRKGTKSGLNSGNGFGGWYINEIIKRLNGDLYMIDETGPEGLGNNDLATSFEIDFPIIEMDEHEEI